MRFINYALLLLAISCTSQPDSPLISVNQSAKTPEPKDEDLTEGEGVSNDPIQDALGDAIEKGNLMVQWIHGSMNCNNDQNPPIQVHKYSDNIYILRQNKCRNYEAPFMYLIMGDEKAFLLDSGAQSGNFPIRTTVEGIINDHYQGNRAQITLIVAHSHAHGDHTAGDGQFRGQAQTQVVGTSQSEVATFFGIQNWPQDQVIYDLGNRPLDILAIPGHETAHIAVFDSKSGVLLTGDSLYPGRLYISQWEVYRSSVTRLLNFLSSKEVRFVLGAHIEMSSTPGQDYPIGTTFQPNEHNLQLQFDALQLLNTELQGIGAQPMRKVTPSFIITP